MIEDAGSFRTLVHRLLDLSCVGASGTSEISRRNRPRWVTPFLLLHAFWGMEWAGPSLSISFPERALDGAEPFVHVELSGKRASVFVRDGCAVVARWSCSVCSIMRNELETLSCQPLAHLLFCPIMRCQV